MSDPVASVLPTRPSALLELALTDFDAVRRSGVDIEMGVWLYLDEDTKKPCAACLAGTVMIEHFAGEIATLAEDGSLCMSPSMLAISMADADALHALSDFAFGEIGRGINLLAQTVPELTPISDDDLKLAEFDFDDEIRDQNLLRRHNLDSWRARMGRALDFLKSRGL